MGNDMELVPNADALASYKKAGSVASSALHLGARQIKSGASMREVLDSVEEYILKKNCGIAFPAQSSVNNVAAHYCPTDTEDIIYEDNMVVKIDVGVHHNGYIGDNAVTVVVGKKHDELSEASKAALAAVEKILRPGCTKNEIGQTITDEIHARGFLPIRNLSGHGLGRFKIHTSPGMPNYPTGEKFALVANQVVAVEPFATNGKTGLIFNASNPTLFSLAGVRPVRSPYARETLELIKTYQGLPFTTRWITRELGSKGLLGLSELRKNGMLNEYPPLPEKSGGFVSQHENTFLITENGCIVLTKDNE
jgi:methionyl aminopeptidase